MKLFRAAHALVAQLDRVSDYESEGQGFESLRARQAKTASDSRLSVVCAVFLFVSNWNLLVTC